MGIINKIEELRLPADPRKGLARRTTFPIGIGDREKETPVGDRLCAEVSEYEEGRDLSRRTLNPLKPRDLMDRFEPEPVNPRSDTRAPHASPGA